MKTRIGEEGTEQFTVTTRINGELVADRKIHDPFAHTTVTLKGWGHAWRALFGGLRVSVSIDGTHGAIRAVMTLDPLKLQQDTEQFLQECAEIRKRGIAAGVVGHCMASEG